VEAARRPAPAPGRRLRRQPARASAEIAEQVLDARIVWRSIDGKRNVAAR
jgi:hypothetical protein